LDPYHVKIAAEAFAAGLLAQTGCDVLVQYGADQPEYDLVASKRRRSIRISVKGSQDGAWGFVQSYKSGASYHEAIERWAADHGSGLVYCFVQFDGVKVGECPRVYLATVREIARHLKAARGGRGTTVMHEQHTYTRGVGVGRTDAVPNKWRFTAARLNELLTRAV